MKLVGIAVVFLVVFSAVPSIAQETTGHIQGRILNPSGKPVPFAQVIVRGPALQGPREVLSLPDGYFYVLALPIGSYTVQVVHVSYQQALIDDVVVRLGAYTNIGAVRLVERVYETEQVVVSAKAPLIDPTSTEIGASLVASEYAELPIDRDYLDMTTLLPHVNRSALGDPANHAGGTGWENKFFIDGVDVTEPLFGSASTELPYNFVREVKVRSGGYQAEYSGSLGGIVDVITRSGSNELSGQAFGFFRNDKLAAEPRLTVSNPNEGTFAEYDVGASIGGPLKDDKLWYFLSYNPRFSKEDVDVPGLGLDNYESTTHCFASKLTWRTNDSNDIEFSAFGDPSTAEGVGGRVGFLDAPAGLENPDPVLMKLEQGGVNLHLKGRHFLHEKFLLQTTASVATRRDNQLPLTQRGRDEALFVDTETGTWSGGSPFNFENSSVSSNVALKGTMIQGSHELKAGIGYTHTEVDVDNRNDVIWRYADPAGDFYYGFTLRSAGSIGSRAPYAFAQDSWRLLDMLRVNIGVRWDGQYVMTSEGDVGQRFLDQWQPRLGLIYSLGESGTNQVFGSYGRFYQNVSLSAASMYFVSGGVYRVTFYDHDPRVDPSVGPGDTVLIDDTNHVIEETDGLQGQHYDEYTLGYEHQLTSSSKASIRGIYRTLQNGLEDVYSEQTDEWFWGNPGSGDLSEFPEMKREYMALELTLQRTSATHFNFLASYVLSRNTGNYPGVFPSDYGDGWANASQQYDLLESFIDGDGLLPNDRTHVFKFSGSYRLNYGVTAGTSFYWMSGTPLNDFGSAFADPAYTVFLAPRGEAGRTPSIWDLNLRLTYDLAPMWTSVVRPRVIVDFLHIASQRKAVNFVQRRYLARDDDGNHVLANPLYGEPTAYQPPSAVRLGLEVGF